MKNLEKIIGILIVVIIFILLIFIPKNGFAPIKKKIDIGIIKIEGTIGFSSITGSGVIASDILKLINEAKADQVKALILRIDSPGGGAAASSEIYHYLMKFKEETKAKVYASFGSTAASGGYYIAVSADKIIAEPSTITGSIGVIMSLINYEELYKKIGIKEIVFKSAPLKDIGSGTRSLTDEEKKVLQTLIDDMYQQFLSVVSKGRNMPIENLKPLADGRIFSGIRAKEAGLVDEVGYLDDTIEIIKKDLGLTKPEIKEYTKVRSILERFGLNLNGLSFLKVFPSTYDLQLLMIYPQ